ncbi:MAG: hypothetical protein N2651_02330, partial [Fimbriimonadales bacterium]|nr:hypothetical protein [Fimbriimonadales bacterium]
MSRQVGWAILIAAVVVALCVMGTPLLNQRRSAPRGQVVHTFADGKRLVLLQTSYGREHEFTHEHKRFLQQMKLSLQAGALEDTVCLWLAIYDPRANRWDTPAFKNALLQVGTNLYFREERASGGESWSAGGWEFGVASGNGDRPPFIPRPEAVMFAAEPTAQRRAEARLWLNAASQPIR